LPGKPQTFRKGASDWLNWGALLSFLAGVLFLVVFALLNL
jgi:hypothetical protein